jgi:phosphatidylinositol glycan class T
VASFEPAGDHIVSENLHLLHGTLPGEVVCTENLTPFLKLLPCKGKAGVASLLDGHKLFDAAWQSMSIDVRPVCAGTECLVQIDQTIDIVLDIDRSKRSRSE